ncbi:MAG: DUF6235 family protein [Actinophytocola sp.]|uniref:DUF6235 family protein n=1 Tax=Actinophytocola sp. TaxID=1872138 RepID=UPI003C77FF65
MAYRLRLASGIDVLDAWTATADIADFIVVADALFTVVERSVYFAYPVIDDPAMAREFVVVVRDNLAIRVRLDDVERFGIVFIGSPLAAFEPRKAPTAESQSGTN